MKNSSPQKPVIKELLQQQNVATAIASYIMVGIALFVLLLNWLVFEEKKYLSPFLLIYSGLILLNILFFRVHRNLYVAYMVLIVFSFFLVIYITCITGGIESPFAFAFLVLPVGASITSRKQGRWWFSASLLTVLLIFFNNFFGFPVRNIIPPEDRDVFAFASLVSILTITTIMSLLVKYFSFHLHQSYTRASSELAEKNQRLELLSNMLNYSTDLMCIIDLPRCTVNDLNPVFRPLLGYEMEEIKGRDFFNFIVTDEETSRTRTRILQMTGQETVDFECRMICKNGDLKKFSWVGMVKGNKFYASARYLPKETNP
ncbi:MAG: PAS domain S-box protein [Bacteroidetes bacterium]|nr:PAS domain S-box protein [Bacteroidota bacterium]